MRHGVSLAHIGVAAFGSKSQIERGRILPKASAVCSTSEQKEKNKRKRNGHSCKSIDHVNPTGMLRMKLGKLLVKNPKFITKNMC